MRDKRGEIIDKFETILSFHKTLGKKGNLQTKFRISSYEKIIKSLKNYNKPIKSLKDVEGIPGIGKSSLEKIDIIIKTGTHPLYEEVISNPQYKSILDFESIWGIGVEKAQELVLEDGIDTIEELREAVERGEVELNEQQRMGLKYYEDLRERIPRKEIKEFTNLLKRKMKKYGIKIENAGSYRLGKKDSGDIDLIFYKKNMKNHTSYAKTELIDNIVNEMREDGILEYIFSKGSQKVIGIIKNPETNKYRQMDVMFVDEEELPWYLLYFGSDKEFSKKIRRMAIEKGYKLSEKGLFDRKSGKKIQFIPKKEKNIFTFLNIPYIPPKNRI
jgi:DNA polymerase beta